MTVRPGDRLTIRYDGPHLPDRGTLAKALPGVEVVLVLVEQRQQAAEQRCVQAVATLTEAGVAPLFAADLVTAMRQAGDDPVTFARNFAWLRGTLDRPVPAGLYRGKGAPGAGAANPARGGGGTCKVSG